MRPIEEMLSTFDERTVSNDRIRKLLPLLRGWIIEDFMHEVSNLKEQFGVNAEIAFAIGCLRRAPEASEVVEAIVGQRLLEGDVALETSLRKFLCGRTESKVSERINGDDDRS